MKKDKVYEDLERLKKKHGNNKYKINFPNLKSNNFEITGNRFDKVNGKKSINDPMFLSKESEETKKEIAKKSKSVSIQFNKGGYMYITQTSDPKDFGRK